MDVKKQTKLVEFLTATPNSDRKAIEKGTKIKGALLTNLFKCSKTKAIRHLKSRRVLTGSNPLKEVSNNSPSNK